MERSTFFDAVDGDRLYYSADFAKVFKFLMLRNGIIRGADDELLTIPGVGLEVIVNTGAAWIEGRRYSNDQAIPLAVPSSDATNSRIDRVVLRLDNSVEARNIKVFIKPGTPSATPSAPALESSVYVQEISLAQYTVAARATSISNFIDERPNHTLCGFVPGQITISVDFGDEDTFYSTTLTGLYGINHNSTLSWKMSKDQTDESRSPEDAVLEEISIQFGNIIPNTSMDVYVYAPNGATGVYVFDIIYS